MLKREENGSLFCKITRWEGSSHDGKTAEDVYWYQENGVVEVVAMCSSATLHTLLQSKL
ncbi:predicted protein [Sclerotinia sclerotiorum 1980 UF-70]|uniref:Uncharacterized protein n=1 Tax=Sclerotinia sclerotiorum (strain ATCC 18683 / 1980 / Ss-1) TaxID=665079 RepID=A7EYX6_SCLS1|nr:predicted protein [Sclerotinia sclerotiorum 1980 UF-70]EDN94668.1 predicted protein [Sclerotinia sclerotiorum 1980 UF-70]